MSISQTAETITITLPISLLNTLPFQIPFFTTTKENTHEDYTITIPSSSIKTSLRLVVIISTYLLFRPHLEKIFRTMMGRGDDNQTGKSDGSKGEMTVKERLDFLRREREGQLNSQTQAQTPTPAMKTTKINAAGATKSPVQGSSSAKSAKKRKG